MLCLVAHFFFFKTVVVACACGFVDPPQIKDDSGFHVYTLHVKTDNTFDLYIDTEIASHGNLLEDMKPPIVPAKEIDDPDDVQPEDWVTAV